MKRPRPVLTAILALGGLVGFMTANASGNLVVAGEQPAPAAEKSEPSVAPPPTTSEQPPPAPALPAEAVYAGNANASPLAIAVAVKGTDASAYLCDGSTVEAWLRGTAVAGQVDLASKDGSSWLTAKFDGTNLAGTVSIGRQEQPFSIGVAPPPAGLYRGKDGATTVGWIILQDGSQVGIATTGGRSTPAPALDPSAGGVTVAGQRVVAEKVVGDFG